MGSDGIRITVLVGRVLRAFLVDASTQRYGMDLIRETGIPSGSLYPVLARLERAGYLLADLEDIDPTVAGRPRRRNYRLNPELAARAAAEVATVADQLRLPSHPTAVRRPWLAGA